MKNSQLALFPRPALEHGGIVRKGRRKIARPIATKKTMHLVFRAVKAKGKKSFLHEKHKGLIHLLLVDVAEHFQVKIHRYENVGNHLLLLVRVKKREHLQGFLRVFPQRVMFLITGARKGNPMGRFWDYIAYSRVVSWGREFRVLKNYLWKNAMEVFGYRREWTRAWQDLPAG